MLSQRRAKECSANVELDTERVPASRWLLERWPALVAAAVATPIAAIAVLGTLYWPGRIFPGFLIVGNTLVPTIGVRDWTGMHGTVPILARVIDVASRPVITNRDVYDYVADRPVGTQVRYSLAKGEE